MRTLASVKVEIPAERGACFADGVGGKCWSQTQYRNEMPMNVPLPIGPIRSHEMNVRLGEPKENRALRLSRFGCGGEGRLTHAGNAP